MAFIVCVNIIDDKTIPINKDRAARLVNIAMIMVTIGGNSTNQEGIIVGFIFFALHYLYHLALFPIYSVDNLL